MNYLVSSIFPVFDSGRMSIYFASGGAGEIRSSAWNCLWVNRLERTLEVKIDSLWILHSAFCRLKLQAQAAPSLAPSLIDLIDVVINLFIQYCAANIDRQFPFQA